MKRHREPQGRELTPAEKRAKWPSYIRWIDDAGDIEKACAYLSKKRGIPIDGVQLARWAGNLKFGIYEDRKHGALKFWALTTPDGRLCEGRRLNGSPWPGNRKSLKFSGSEGALIGEQLLGSDPDPVLLVEGGPDFLAACFLARRAMELASNRVWIPLGILGATNHFHQPLHRETLAKLAGRKVRIIGDSDDGGRKAAKKWAGQLLGAGAIEADLAIFAGDVIEGAKDLNDIFTMGEPGAVENFIREVVQ